MGFEQILVELQESMGSDESIANAAWTSTYDKNKREDKYDDPDKVKKVVELMINSDPPHGTPIESVIFRFWIRMPIFTDRQHMTHRIASHNGLSGRYRTMPNDWYHLPQDVNDILVKLDNLPKASKSNPDPSMWISEYEVICSKAYSMYNDRVEYLKRREKDGTISNTEFKRVREVLRGMLPTAGMVERTTIMNLRAFANYYRLRANDHAQPEIQQVAKLMLSEIEKANICPVAISALKKRNWIL